MQARILIVDDSTTIRRFHRREVEKLGASVEEAANGMEGLEKVLSEPFDLLLVDINMPKMDGYSFLREVRRNEAVQHVPAIMISTEAEKSDREKAYKAGANFYLVKPTRNPLFNCYVALLTENA